MIGASPVATAAPTIPMPQGKIITQSSTTLESEPMIMALMASRGAPSLRTKPSRTLLSRNAGPNDMITRR